MSQTESGLDRRVSPTEPEAQEPLLARSVKCARLLLPHVGLIVLCVLYVVLGATGFYMIEHQEEQRLRSNNLQKLLRTKNNILNDLRTMSFDQSITENQFKQAVSEKSDVFTKILYDSFAKREYVSLAAFRNLIAANTILEKTSKADWQKLDNATMENRIENDTPVPDTWTFAGALLFATATLTTVGACGWIAPMTCEARLLCVGYALLGIPLIRLAIADVGKILAECLMSLCRLWTRCRKGVSNRLRKSGRRSKKSPNFDKPGQKEEKQNENEGAIEEMIKKENSEAESDDELFVVATSVPVAWCFLLVVAYTFLGAALFALTEPWSIWDSFYFSFITTTTIGLGDFKPSNQNHACLTFVYVVLGLVITTVCIDQVSVEYIRKIHYFGRKIQSVKESCSKLRNKR